MTDTCPAVRSALLRDPDADAAHCAACAPCARFARGLRRVDAALRRDAADVPALPEALRARILAAASPPATATSTDSLRGRVLELVVRAAAVAAVLGGVAVALPVRLAAAAEMDVTALGELPRRMGAALRLPDALDLRPAVDVLGAAPQVQHAGALGAASLVLAAAGFALLVRERRR